MQGPLRKIGFGVIWAAIVFVITLPSVFPLPYTPLLTPLLATAAGLVGYRMSETILDKATGKEPKSVVLLKHYDELKNEVFAKWKDGKVVLTTESMLGTAHHTASYPLLLKVEEGEMNVLSLWMALDHLKNRKYKRGKEHYDSCMELMKAHNEKISDLVELVKSDLRLVLLRYPMLAEQTKDDAGSGDNRYKTSLILRAICGQQEVSITDKAIHTDLTITRADDQLVRQLFLGEIRSLTEKYRERFEKLLQDVFLADTEWRQFSYFCSTVINSIVDLHELRGACDFEKGRFQTHA